MISLPATPELLRVAKRVVWFSEPLEALADPLHLLSHAMTYGTIEDIVTLEAVAPTKNEAESVVETALRRLLALATGA